MSAPDHYVRDIAVPVRVAPVVAAVLAELARFETGDRKRDIKGMSDYDFWIMNAAQAVQRALDHKAGGA